MTDESKLGIYTHREWRGVRDTAYDFAWWLVMWRDMAALILRRPRLLADTLRHASWASAFFSIPADIDSALTGRRGLSLRVGRTVCNAAVKRTLAELSALLDDRGSFQSRIVRVAGSFPIALMSGFTALTALPLGAPFVFPHREAPAPLPTTAHIGKCLVICGAEHIDGWECTYKITLPTAELDESTAIRCLADELVGCIRFIEHTMDAHFDWDAFFAVLEAQRRITAHTGVPAAHFTSAQTADLAAWQNMLCGIYRRSGLDAQFMRTLLRLRRLIPDDSCTRFLPSPPDTASTRAAIEYIAREMLQSAGRE